MAPSVDVTREGDGRGEDDSQTAESGHASVGAGVLAVWSDNGVLVGYSVPKKQFYFYYSLQGESVVHQIFPNPDEFRALADMFRNEGPINFNTTGSNFVSAAE